MFTTSAQSVQPPSTAMPDARTNPWLVWSVETPEERRILSVADLAECCCPDLCDRDHANE